MVTSRLFLLAGLSALAGCVGPGGATLVSAQYPQGMGEVNANSEPEPANSLPLGAATFGGVPGARLPNYISWTFGSR